MTDPSQGVRPIVNGGIYLIGPDSPDRVKHPQLGSRWAHYSGQDHKPKVSGSLSPASLGYDVSAALATEFGHLLNDIIGN